MRSIAGVQAHPGLALKPMFYGLHSAAYRLPISDENMSVGSLPASADQSASSTWAPVRHAAFQALA